MSEEQETRKLKVIIDSNIFISVINKESTIDDSKQILQWIENNQIIGIISTINISEILIGYYKNNDTINAQKFLQNVNSHYKIVDVNQEIANEAAKIRSKKTMKLPDALIFSTAKHINGDFIISLDKDFIKSCGKIGIHPTDFIRKNQNKLFTC